MTNSWLATSTGLKWNAWTGSGGVSIHVYSHIRPIIRKSELIIYIHRYCRLNLAKQSPPHRRQKQWLLPLPSLSGEKGGHFEAGTSQGHAKPSIPCTILRW